jgi:hypothetical protein
MFPALNLIAKDVPPFLPRSFEVSGQFDADRRWSSELADQAVYDSPGLCEGSAHDGIPDRRNRRAIERW